MNLVAQVENLKSNLQSVGSDLAVVMDKPENAIQGMYTLCRRVCQ